MKCISLWQPWASLMVYGLKRVETRSWATNYRGPLLIHAAMKWNRDLNALACSGEIGEALKSIGTVWSRGGKRFPRPEIPFGAIIGQVTLDECVATKDVHFTGGKADICRIGMAGGWQFPEAERPFGDYSAGRFAWICSNPVKFAKPIAYRGMQQVFDVPTEILN